MHTHRHTHTDNGKSKNEPDAIAAFFSKIGKCMPTAHCHSFILTSDHEESNPSMSLYWEKKERKKETNKTAKPKKQPHLDIL